MICAMCNRLRPVFKVFDKFCHDTSHHHWPKKTFIKQLMIYLPDLQGRVG